nr:gamma-glutamylcyclotransferase-like isoform X2 [Plodia interpunctella]
MFMNYWNGSVATIVPHPGRKVWGALWNIDINDMERLDKQEGVPEGWYYPLNVKVITSGGKTVVAHTYQMTNVPQNEDKILPSERRPSNTYLQVITLGAVESKLPSDYVGSLFTFVSNGNFANKAIREYLGYPF